MARRKLTAIVPTFDEEQNVVAVLESVRFADEVLVVDSFSTDRTVERARTVADRVLQREYGYSASQKNWAIPRAAHEWILIVDADERVTEDLRREVEGILAREVLPERAFWIRRANRFLGKRVRFSGWRNDRVIRLFHRDLRYEDKRVHAEIVPDGPVGRLARPLEHDTARELGAYLAKQDRYSTWAARDALERGVRPSPYHFLVKPWYRFVRQYLFQGGFLDGATGFVICSVDAAGVFMRYVKLWGLRRTRGE